MNNLQAIVSEAKRITITNHHALPTITIETGSTLFGTTKKHNYLYAQDGKAIRQYASLYGKAIEYTSKNESMTRGEALLLHEIRKALINEQ